MKEINTKRFIITFLEKKYIQNVFNILSDVDVIKTLNMDIHKTLTDTNKLFDDYYDGFYNNTKFPFAIIDKNTKEFIGVFLIKLDIYDIDSYEFTIYLDKKYWHKNVYSEILPEMTKYALNNIKMTYFRGFVMEKNIASRRVLEKSGFKLEKIFKVPGIDDNIYSYYITFDDIND